MVEDFDTWYEDLRPKLGRALAAWCGDAALASDALDEAFVRAVERWDRVRAMDAPAGWVWRTAMNVSRRAARRRKHEDRLVVAGSAAGPVDGPAVDDVDLRAALRQLTDRQRTVIVLHHIADLPVKEVAAALDIAVGTVTATLHQARTRLAELLDITDDPTLRPGGSPHPRSPHRWSCAMTDLDTRLRALAETYPTDHPPADLVRRRAGSRRHRRRARAAIAVVVPLVVLAAGLVVWNLGAQPDDQVRTGPGPELTTGTTDSTEAPPTTNLDPIRTLGGVGGVTVEVAPRTGLHDGDLVAVEIAGLEKLPKATLLLCAGDVTESTAASVCDTTAVRDPEADPSEELLAKPLQQVRVARFIAVSDGSDTDVAQPYDCATEPDGCVLAVGPYTLPARAVLVPLSFEAEDVPTPSASIEPKTGLRDGQQVTVRAEGLRPHSDYGLELCAVEVDETDPTGRTRCETLAFSGATADADGTLTASLRVWASLFDYSGRIDCTAEPCVVDLTQFGVVAEVPIRFGPDVVAPEPSLSISPPGPYRDLQTVTVRGTGFRPGFDIGGQLGQCPNGKDTATEERCSYSRIAPLLVDPDGGFTTTLRLFARGPCAPGSGCHLGWVIPHGTTLAKVPLSFEG